MKQNLKWAELCLIFTITHWENSVENFIISNLDILVALLYVRLSACFEKALCVAISLFHYFSDALEGAVALWSNPVYCGVI